MTSILVEIQPSNRAIISSTLDKNFDQKYIFYLGLEGQPEVENTPTSLYMGERAWNDLFQNIYFVLGILHGLEGTEP